MRWRGLFALAFCAGTAVQASDTLASDTLPEFSACMDTQIAYFERDFGPGATTTSALEGFQNGHFDWVDFCGMVGIIHCDYAPEPLTCQRDLRARQDALRDDILTHLPAPEAVRGQAGQWSDALYSRVVALAYGSSAGEDCAGMPEVMEVWCEARQATVRLGLAITAWQVARYLNAADPATDAGWAALPQPLRPRERPEGTR